MTERIAICKFVAWECKEILHTFLDGERVFFREDHFIVSILGRFCVPKAAAVPCICDSRVLLGKDIARRRHFVSIYMSI